MLAAEAAETPDCNREGTRGIISMCGVFVLIPNLRNAPTLEATEAAELADAEAE